jgi:drug/metabolite transporter (DMT)-like permease
MNERAGEIAALFASFSWAIGSLVFSRVKAPPAALNLFKNVLAALLFLVSLTILTLARGVPLPRPTASSLAWLALSSLIGLVIGDTLYFRSLQALGPRRALVLTTLAPTLATALAWWTFGETLPATALLGIAATLLGVAWVVRVREGGGEGETPEASGVACGILGAFCQALGAVCSKLGMSELDPLEASFVRLVFAAGLGLLAALAARRLRAWTEALFAPGVPLRLTAASACGTYLGIWLSLAAFKHSRLAVATTLTSLSPVFVIPLAWLFLGQRTSLAGILGAALAVTGVAILF